MRGKTRSMAVGRRSMSHRAQKKWIFLSAAALLAWVPSRFIPPSSVWAQMRIERELSAEEKPFVLKGFLSPASPGRRELVEITAEIRSKVVPHVRTVVRFWVDGKKREETSYVIAPFAESIVTHEWEADEGIHTVKVELLSPAGVVYESWEKEISIK